jgi:HEPN domain-containing protein
MEKNWLSQSERDLITAKNCTRSGDFYASAFFCHQSIEKCLKALYISRFDDLPPKTHHIDKLAILLEAPDDIVNITYALSEDYMMTRYPDVTDKLPFQSYNEQMASQKISQSEKLLLWVKNKLGE